jgi:hypothetical protein
MRKRERYKWALMLESFSMGQTQQAYIAFGGKTLKVMVFWFDGKPLNQDI